jgi:hypothetical protein
MTPGVEVVGKGPYVHVPAVGWLMRDLRITKPVRILWGEERDFSSPKTNGYYAEESGYHYIVLRPSRSTIQASIRLCHELVHCSQAERDPDFFRSYKRTGGYFYGNKYESECRVREVDLALRYHPVR